MCTLEYKLATECYFGYSVRANVLKLPKLVFYKPRLVLINDLDIQDSIASLVLYSVHTWQDSSRDGSSSSMGSLIKDHVGLAFVHGCQYTTVPRLFHQVHRYVQIFTTLPMPKATVPNRYSSRIGRNESLSFDFVQTSYELQPNLWPKVTIEGSQQLVS